MMKKKSTILVVAIVSLIAIIAASFLWLFPLDWDESRTLTSLRRVSEHPFYVMHYYGDYGFQVFLQEGIYPTRMTSQVSLSAVEGFSCTCFAALGSTDEKLFGRNFDWYEDPVLLLFTDPPGGYASVSMVDIRYLGYDQSGVGLLNREALLDAPYLPFDGMNEHGLAVGMMAVPYADGGDDPEKVTISELQVIRLLLDNAMDVESAISILEEFNVLMEDPPIHYLVADSKGNAAVIEFLGGEMHVLPNTNPWQVSTNFIISNVQPGSEREHCWRYAKADETLETAQGQLTQQDALNLLRNVSQPNTQWSNVYNLTTGQIIVTLARDYEEIYEFSLK